MANTGVKGRIVYLGSNDGIEGLKIIAVDYDPIYSEDVLGSDTTKGDGSFEIKYTSDKYRNWYERNPDIVVRVYGPSGRLIYETAENENTDVNADTLTICPIAIHENNIGNKERGEPWLVTYATLDPKDGSPVWLTQGNQIEPLTDGARIFPELTKAIEGAQQSVHIMNWKFDVKNNPITKFNKEIDDPKWYLNPKEGQKVEGKKVQEILKERAEAGVKVNVVVWDFNVEAVVGSLFATVALVLGGGGFVVGNALMALLGMPFLPLAYLGRGSGDTAADVEDYFKGSKVETAGFQSLWSLMHARAVIIDGKEAFVMGSSIDRKSYNESGHFIHDARHGGTLWHDVSLKLYGPAVEHLDRTVATVWNAANPAGCSSSRGALPVKNKLIPTKGPFPVKNSEDLAGVQVIRTLPGDIYDGSHTDAGEGRKPSVPKVIPGKKGIPYGETGPLEAYQRAIACAKDFIYIEDQYLTSPDIVTALIQRMTDKDEEARQLQLIIVLNIKPDHPDYRKLQENYLLQLKAKIDSDRLGIFTLWSCREATPKEAPRYEITPIYVHSKVGIVDDKWASMGTANLDGASMNQIQTVTTVDHSLKDITPEWVGFIEFILFPITIFLSLLFKLIVEVGGIFVYRRPTQHANPNRSNQPSRFTDLRLVVYNNVAGQPETDSVVHLRDQLWQEHLGYLLDSPQKDDYPTIRPVEGWLKLWKDRANEKLEKIKKEEGHPALILEWQPETDPEKYLRALDIKTKNYFIREKADSFDLVKGKWNKKK